MIEASVAKSTAGVAANTKVVSRIGEIDQKSKAVQYSLNEILTKAKEVDSLVATIATASKEQSTGLDQITMAIGQIDQVTQKNASGSEEAAAAAEEMNSQSKELVGAVHHLLSLVNKRGNGSTAVIADSPGSAGKSLGFGRRDSAAR